MSRGFFKPFSEEQENFIKDNYLLIPVKRIASITNCSHGRIMRFLKENDLEIPRHIIEQRKVDSRIKKGQVPRNKGKKQVEYMSAEAIEKTKLTRFKKGHVPHNTNKQGDGAITKRRDSNGKYYKYIRIKKGVWELYHRYLWEQVNGKIPDGHIVVFKDGDSDNTNIDNLELITLTENMFRNSKHNYPSEIIPSLVLTKKIENKLKNLKNG